MRYQLINKWRLAIYSIKNTKRKITQKERTQIWEKKIYPTVIYFFRLSSVHEQKILKMVFTITQIICITRKTKDHYSQKGKYNRVLFLFIDIYLINNIILYFYHENIP